MKKAKKGTKISKKLATRLIVTAILSMSLFIVGAVWIFEFYDPQATIFKCPGIYCLLVSIFLFWRTNKLLQKVGIVKK